MYNSPKRLEVSPSSIYGLAALLIPGRNEISYLPCQAYKWCVALFMSSHRLERKSPVLEAGAASFAEFTPRVMSIAAYQDGLYY